MATRPDVSAFITHEERVRAFMASVPPRRRWRVEAKYRVLDEDDEQQIRDEERLWSPEALDQVLASKEGTVRHTPHKGEPSYLD